jgi:hypothetical protein
MNLAPAIPHKLVATLRCFWQSMRQPTAQQVRTTTATARAIPRDHSACAHPAMGRVHTAPPLPLRVVRVLENGQHRSSVGRMVISGSMADVCAELDRLAACEAVLH